MLLSLEVFQFPNLLNYVSFELSGIYDAAFLEARKSYIFSGEKYRSAQVDITNTIINYANKWKDAANHVLDFTDYFSPPHFVDIIGGKIYLQ